MDLRQIWSVVANATLPANDPDALAPAAQPVRDQSPAEHSWEDEGGSPIEPAPRVRRRESAGVPVAMKPGLAQQATSMSERLATDFANARCGVGLKIWAHRARVLRQLKARLKNERDGTPAVEIA